jgi:hypothetical protein
VSRCIAARAHAAELRRINARLAVIGGAASPERGMDALRRRLVVRLHTQRASIETQYVLRSLRVSVHKTITQ